MFGYDDRLKDAGAVTSSGYGTVEEAAKVINLGAGLVRGNVIVDVTRLAMQGNIRLTRHHKCLCICGAVVFISLCLKVPS